MKEKTSNNIPKRPLTHHPPLKGDLPLHPAITPPLMTSLRGAFQRAADAGLGNQDWNAVEMQQPHALGLVPQQGDMHNFAAMQYGAAGEWSGVITPLTCRPRELGGVAVHRRRPFPGEGG